MNVVIVICGIPGSGKSYFTRLLFDKLQCDRNNNVNIITFDDYELSKDKWNDKTFKVNRNKAIYHMHMLLTSNSQMESNNNIILVDDIMYLYSMRKQIYLISKSYDYLFINIYIYCDLTIALGRNNNRSSDKKVEANTIINIYNKFEIPNKLSHKPCDMYSYHLNSEEDCLSNINNLLVNHFNDWIHYYNEFIINKSNETNKMLLDFKSSKSTSHQLDKKIRKINNSIMTSVADIIGNINNLSTIRKEISNILITCKNEIIKSSHHLSSEENQNNEEIIDSYVLRYVTLVIRKIKSDNIIHNSNEIATKIERVLDI